MLFSSAAESSQIKNFLLRASSFFQLMDNSLFLTMLSVRRLVLHPEGSLKHSF